MRLLIQVNETAFLIVAIFGITLLAWRYLFQELETASAQASLAIYLLACTVLFTTSLILIWIP